MANKENLLLLFERPMEPYFMLKGGNKRFDFKEEMLSSTYQGDYEVFSTFLRSDMETTLGNTGVSTAALSECFGDTSTERIPLKPIRSPCLGEILDLPRNANFSLFIPKHSRIAGKLIDIFLSSATFDDFQSTAAYVRDKINPYLFNYAFSVAILHRFDSKDLEIPPLIQSFPDKFVDCRVFQKIRENTFSCLRKPEVLIEIPQNYTASNLEEEQRLAYFREDLGINLHHWHWHMVYPSNCAMQVVKKDRRGELFYYMHQQIMARYNFERFCNNLTNVTRFNEWKEPIKEAYFPKMNSSVAGCAYPGRAANQTIQDLNIKTVDIQQDVDDMYRWRDRIFHAIHSGTVQKDDGTSIVLTENEGIDILGNIVESSILSPNKTLYGDLHNFGHLFISYAHDPDHRYLEHFGVMGETSTAMRDPVFYRWHAFINDLFQEYKETLPGYTVDQLNYDGISVITTRIETDNYKELNTIDTFWQQSKVDLSKGLDFHSRQPVYAKFTHLQHKQFTYKIRVNNTGEKRMGTCRIFLAPKFDEHNNPWLFKDQRLLFIELDRFVVNLKEGQTMITRCSTDSSVTIPFEQTFRNSNTNQTSRDRSNYCGCGWPQHMLVPKGTTGGFQCELFVMISNFEEDAINEQTEDRCKHSLGYPFESIDILTNNIVESSVFSPNRTLYGHLHSLGHVFISFAHDPAVMKYPVLNRWHAFINDFFVGNKAALPRYTIKQSNYNGISVIDSKIKIDYKRYAHLQHKQLTCNITVNNTGEKRMVTGRIFLGPKFDECNNPQTFVELKQFDINLTEGENKITDQSTDALVTMFEPTFDEDRFSDRGNDLPVHWPEHMLEPKATPEGFQCELFFMITNFGDDAIKEQTEGRCKNAMSYCGLKDSRYPDKRSMGYPFDRKPRDGVKTLQDFLTCNMCIQDVNIKFSQDPLQDKNNELTPPTPTEPKNHQ